MNVFYTTIQLPTGHAAAVATDNGIARLELRIDSLADFVEGLAARFRTLPVESDRPFKTLTDELMRYFAGEPVTFTDRLDIYGTEFQRQVWHELRSVPYGEVRSYKWLAEACGRPMAARAVGGAVGANRLPIIIPCQRIVASGGGLGGYAYGLDMKRMLLGLEKIVV